MSDTQNKSASPNRFLRFLHAVSEFLDIFVEHVEQTYYSDKITTSKAAPDQNQPAVNQRAG